MIFNLYFLFTSHTLSLSLFVSLYLSVSVSLLPFFPTMRFQGQFGSWFPTSSQFYHSTAKEPALGQKKLVPEQHQHLAGIAPRTVYARGWGLDNQNRHDQQQCFDCNFYKTDLHYGRQIKAMVRGEVHMYSTSHVWMPM